MCQSVKDRFLDDARAAWGHTNREENKREHNRWPERPELFLTRWHTHRSSNNVVSKYRLTYGLQRNRTWSVIGCTNRRFEIEWPLQQHWWHAKHLLLSDKPTNKLLHILYSLTKSKGKRQRFVRDTTSERIQQHKKRFGNKSACHHQQHLKRSSPPL